MDIWIKWTRKQAICRYCDKPILVATPMVVGKIWRKGDETKRSWNIKLYWHPQCWIANAMDYLSRNPYTQGNKGRPKLQLSEEDGRKRYLLLRRKAALDQRKKKLTATYPDRALQEAKINTQILDIMMDIAGIGGIPKKWLNSEQMQNI